MSHSGTAKFHSLDAYRFIAAVGVVLFHYLYDFKILERQDATFVSGLPVMVDFFFVLSGFVIAVSYRDRIAGVGDYGRFLKARFARIYPLHFLTFIGMAAAGLAATHLGVKINHPEAFAADGVAPTLFLTQAWGVIDHQTFNAASWSLSAEFFVYLLAPLCFWLSRRLSLTAGLTLAVALFVGVEYLRAENGARTIMLATYDMGMLRAVPSFLAGVFIATATPRLARSLGGWARWSVAHGLGGAILVGLWAGLAPAALVVLFATMMAIAAMCETRGLPSALRSVPMRTLGDMSFAIYMLHGVDLVAIVLLRRMGWLDGGLISWVAMATTFAVTMVAAYFCFRWIETPARRRINAMTFGRAAREGAAAPVG